MIISLRTLGTGSCFVCVRARRDRDFLPGLLSASALSPVSVSVFFLRVVPVVAFLVLGVFLVSAVLPLAAVASSVFAERRFLVVFFLAVVDVVFASPSPSPAASEPSTPSSLLAFVDERLRVELRFDRFVSAAFTLGVSVSSDSTTASALSSFFAPALRPPRLPRRVVVAAFLRARVGLAGSSSAVLAGSADALAFVVADALERDDRDRRERLGLVLSSPLLDDSAAALAAAP